LCKNNTLIADDGNKISFDDDVGEIFGQKRKKKKQAKRKANAINQIKTAMKR
jgi:hypothetical protein